MLESLLEPRNHCVTSGHEDILEELGPEVDITAVDAIHNEVIERFGLLAFSDLGS